MHALRFFVGVLPTLLILNGCASHNPKSGAVSKVSKQIRQAGPTAIGILKAHPSGTLHLGACFDANNLQQKKRSVFKNISPADPLQVESVDTGARSVGLSIELVSNARELFESLNISHHLEADFYVASGSTSFKLANRHHFSVRNITLIIKSECDYGRFRPKTLEIDPAVTGALQVGLFGSDVNMAEFRRAFGTHFVAMERRAVVAAVVITVYGLDQDKQSKLALDVSAKAGLMGFGGSTSFSFSNETREILSNSKVQVDFYANGGPGIGRLGQLMVDAGGGTNPDTLLGQAASASYAYVAEMSSATAPAVEYFPQELSQLVLNFEIDQGELNGDERKQRSESFFRALNVKSANYAKRLLAIQDNDPSEFAFASDDPCSSVELPLNEWTLKCENGGFAYLEKSADPQVRRCACVKKVGGSAKYYWTFGSKCAEAQLACYP